MCVAPLDSKMQSKQNGGTMINVSATQLDS
jgi:hypothetical protein